MTGIDNGSPVDLLGNIKRFIFTTNSAIWFEKDLTEKLVDYKVKIPLEIDIYSLDQSIQWLKKQKLKWLIHSKEIEIAKKYNHFWPFVRFDGKIIGSIKIGFKRVYIADYDQIIDLPVKTAFIYDTYVLQEKRGKGVAKFLITETIKYLKSNGFLKVNCHIPSWNKSSITAYEQIGFHKIGYIRFFRIFGYSFFKEKNLNSISKIKGYRILKEGIIGG